MTEHLLDVQNLRVNFHTNTGVVRAVEDASFYVDQGEIVGLVGESGSGKSVSMMSLLKLIPTPPGEIAGGKILFQGEDLAPYTNKSAAIRKIRGGGISMIFQEPMTSLNPVLTIGEQIMESIILHLGMSKAEARKRTLELLEMVGIPDSQSRIDAYPNQFSGGMRQRIMIAMAMSCNPKLLIADEATTALDVTTQEQILELMRDIVKKTGTSLILITHNLSIIARYAERIYVMYAGRIVEKGNAEELFGEPAHPYTMGLLRAIPRLDSDRTYRLLSIDGMPINPAMKPDYCPFADRCAYVTDECKKIAFPEYRQYSDSHFAACVFKKDELESGMASMMIPSQQWEVKDEPILELKHLSKYYPVTKGLARRKIGEVKALDDINLTIYRGETLGVVGESGCGKTTLAKTILRLHETTSGEMIFGGRDISKLSEKNLKDVRRKVQFIFQDPFGSLDPRQSAEGIVGEALRSGQKNMDRKAYNDAIDQLFVDVGLSPALRDRVPHEFSGGQRQRLCIAAALASNPEFVICDEPISALDVSIQSQIINLLIDLKAKRGLTYMFIAHDLSVVRHISDRIVVMYLGKVMEIAKWDQLYSNPTHPYTKALLSAIPVPDPVKEKQRERVEITGEVPSLMKRPSGCVFHTRCPYATEQCKTNVPELRTTEDGHQVACFRVNG